MEIKEIQMEEKPPIAILRINRPKNLNALNMNCAKELFSALQYCADHDKIRAIILSGTGRAFSAGGDVKDFKKAVDDGTQDKFISNLSEILHKIIYLIRTMPKPIIAAINGFAMGAGLNIGLACDLIIAADTAKFNEAFVNVGLAIDGGGTYILPKLIGRAKALEFMISGKMMDANEAENLGLINKVVPASELDTITENLALKLANGPTKAIGSIKKLVEEGYLTEFKTQLEKERQNQIQISLTEDFKEGVNAFSEKRDPKFKGK